MADATLDVSDVPRSEEDAPRDAGVPTVLRLHAPLSTSYLAGRAPTLRWLGGEDAAQIALQICADRACATVVRALMCAPSGVCRVDAPLDPGVYFWHARAIGSRVSSGTWTPTWQFRVKHGRRTDGGPVGLTLDLDGDGRDDLVYPDDGMMSWNERMWLRYGADLAVATSLTIDPIGSTGSSPPSASAGGDLNGDGLGDLVIGQRVDPSTSPGLVFWVWYRGGVAGLLPVVSARFAIPSSDAPTHGTTDGSVTAFARGAGDVNGDGYGDVAVASRNFVDGSPQGGCIYVYPGGPEGPQPGVVQASCDHGAGPEARNFGNTLAAGGDFNGDGFADVVAVSGAGVVRVRQFLGGPAGLDRFTDVTLAGPSPCFESATMIGDVNADAYSDLALCVVEADGVNAEVEVFLGGPGGLAATPAAVAWLPFTLATGSRTVAGALAGGDLDGDVYDDLVIGTGGGHMGIPPDAVVTGMVGVFAGTSTGVASTPRVLLYGPDGAGGRFGDHVAIPGDIDGDGLADVFVGADAANTAPPDLAPNYVGGVYLYPGPIPSDTVIPVHAWHGNPDDFLGFWVGCGAL